MKKFWFILLLCACISLSANELLKEYPFYRTLTFKESSEIQKPAAVPFDKFLYKNTNEHYSNLLILDQNRKPVPFALRNTHKMVSETRQTPCAGKITGFLWNSKANTVTVDFTLNGESQEINGLIFHTKLKRFDKKVTLRFFDSEGKQVREEKNLSLYQHGAVYGNSAVNFPNVKAKKIVAVIHRYMEEKEYIARKESAGPAGVSVERIVRQEEYQLTSVSAYRKETLKKAGETVKTAIELPEISRRNKGKVTEIRVSAHRVPCTDLTITADDPMFKRRIEIFTVEDEKEYLLTDHQLSPDQKEIELPDNRADEYIIRIFNESNEPLKNIRLGWRVVEKNLILLPSGKILKLYYGGNAPKQNYDIEHFADKFENPPRSYLIGAETKSPEYAPAVPKNMIFQVFMWVFFGVDALVLLVIIVRLLRKSPEDEE